MTVPADSPSAVAVEVLAMGRSVPIVVMERSADRPTERVSAFVAALVAAWSRCEPSTTTTSPEAARRSGVVIELDGTDDRAALARTTSLVTTRAIDAAAGEHLLVHAAACADEESGLAACFVGPSGRGKTTASIALGRDFGYLTDEATAIDGHGRVLPYPKPLSVRIPGSTAKEQRSPDALGLRASSSRDWPLGAVFLLDRGPGEGEAGAPGGRAERPLPEEPTVRAVTLSEAIIALAPELSSLHRLDRPLQRLASLIERVGPVLRLRYSEACTLAPVVRRVLAERAATRVDRPAPRGGWSPAALAAPAHPHAAAGPPRLGTLRRAPVVDAIVAGDSLVVWRDGSVMAAGGLAPLLWRFAAEWTDLVTLRESLVAELGETDGADAHVAAAVEAMCAAGLLERASA